MPTPKKHALGLYFVYTMKKIGTLFTFVLFGGSVFLVATHQYPSIATAMWCVSIILLVILWYDKQETPKQTGALFPLLCILVVAFVLRTYHLTILPSFVHGDEAWIGIEANKILSSSVQGNMFELGWYGYPQLTFLLAAIPMKLFGASLFSLRLSSVLLGLLSIAFCYFMVQAFRNTKEAIIASIFLTCSHLHIHFSRIGTHYMQGLVFIEIALLFFLLSMKYKRTFFLLIAGIGTGLGFQVYLSARITGIVIGGTMLAFFLFRHKKLISWQHLGVLGIGILFGIGPYCLSLISTNGRTSEVFLLNNLHHLISVYQTSDWQTIIVNQILRTGSFLIGGTDRSVQYGIQSAGIDIETFIASSIGLFLWIRSIFIPNHKEKRDDFSLLFFTCMVVWIFSILCIGGIATIDAPFYPRLLPCIVPICILSAYAIHQVTTRVSKPFQYILLFVSVGYICITNVYSYFSVYPRLAIYRNTALYTVIGNIASIYRGSPIILVADSSLSFDYATIHFLAPSVNGITVTTVSEAFEKATPSTVVIVTNVTDYEDLTHLQIAYPPYRWQTMYTNTKEPLLYYTQLPK